MEYESISGVYFIRETETGLVKIGKSQNCKMRLQSYNTFPFPIEFIFFLESERRLELEKAFKHLFKDRQENGEWFRLPFNVVEWIQDGNYPEQIMDYIEETSKESMQKIINHLKKYKNFKWKDEEDIDR